MSKAIVKRSEHLYRFLLQFYPKRYRDEFGEEMHYVFSQSLKDAYIKSGEQGVFFLWIRTIVDAGKSLMTQHLEAQKGGESMKTKQTNTSMQNSIFRIAVATVVLLLIPILGQWPWSVSDFVIMGGLIFGTGVAYVVIAKKAGKKHRYIVAAVLLVVFVLIWAELAVGIIGTPFAGD